jgi:2-hydroxychromene-2-carboxylate isomerase
MPATIDFYYDFSSPYGYFAATRINALAARYGRSVNWHPILLGAIFKTTGAQPLPLIPVKGGYALRDMLRTARMHDIPCRVPEKFPCSTQLAARAVLWTANAHGADKAVELTLALYRAYFADGHDITDADTVAAVAKAAGLDGAALVEGANDPVIKDQLKSEVEAALARGVFGSPYVIVDAEPFWGFDRFDQLEAWLKHGRI